MHMFFYVFITSIANIIYKFSSSLTRMFIATYIGIGQGSDIILYIISMPFRIRRFYCDLSIRNILIPTYKEKGINTLLIILPWITTLIILVNLILHGCIFFMSETFLSNFFRSNNLQHTLYLFNIILPYMFFFIINNILNTFLDFKKHFFFTSIMSTIYNICIISSIYLYQFSNDPSINISIYILISGIIQLFITILYFYYQQIPLKIIYAPFIEVKNYFYNIFKNNIGEYAIQINVLVSSAIIYTIPKGITYMILALNLYYVPITIFGKAIRTTILPILCTEKDPQKSFLYSSFYTMLICLGLTYFFFFSTETIIDLLLIKKHKYTIMDIKYITNNLSIFYLGLTPQIMSYIPLSYLYSRKIIWPTVYIAIFTSILNITLNYFTLEYLYYYTYTTNFSLVFWVYTSLLYIACYYYYDKNIQN